jgi:hypothetical protein
MLGSGGIGRGVGVRSWTVFCISHVYDMISQRSKDNTKCLFFHLHIIIDATCFIIEYNSMKFLDLSTNTWKNGFLY